MKRIAALVLALGLVACAQVPKESVELSTTVGRDIAEAHESHVKLAEFLFGRMKSDVNRFVNDVYVPHQMRKLFEAEAVKAEKPGASPSNSMLLLINVAFSDEGTREHQAATIKVMTKFSMALRNDVEDYRATLLKPIEEQEAEVLGGINRHYQQMHYGNSIVTGHLSSIVKVHEVQDELLDAIGIESDLRTVVGTTLVKASVDVNNLVEQGENAEVKIDDFAGKLQKIMGPAKN